MSIKTDYWKEKSALVMEKAYPKICPACKDVFPKSVPPSIILIEDEKLPCKWLVMIGWKCYNKKLEPVYFGTVIRHGDPKNRKKVIEIISHEHSYIEFPNSREITMYDIG